MSIVQPKKSQQLVSERFCRYIHRYCFQSRLDGFDYCIRHILEDKNAPFKQCSFVHPSNKKRCTNAAPKNEKSEKRDTILCPFHLKQALRRSKTSRLKKKSVDGPADSSKKLEHHSSLPSCSKSSYTRERSSLTTCTGQYPSSLNPPSVSGIADEESEPWLVENTSARSIEEDPEWLSGIPNCLRHAGVYTEKEILKLMVKKITCLQKTYCTELEYIQRKLQQKTKECVSLLKRHPPAFSSSFTEAGSTDAKLLKSLLSYRRRSQAEKVLHLKAQQKQSVTKLIDLKETKDSTCMFEENGTPCEKKTLLLSKFCKDHILSDSYQVMYKPCRFASKENCNNPILSFEDCCDKHLPKTNEQVLKMQAPLPLPDLSSTFAVQDPDSFLSLDEMSSSGFEVAPEFYFKTLDAGGESTESVLSDDHADLMEIEPVTLKPPLDILCDSAKSESETEEPMIQV